MKDNRLQSALRDGRVPVGHFIGEFATRGIAKIVEAADPDFVIIDMEHAGFDAATVADLVAWFKATTIAPFVRVPQNLYHFLTRTMDAGALGVMIGNVESADAARSIISAVKYAPLGSRGISLSAGHTDYGSIENGIDFMRQSNECTTVIAQIESMKGLDNVEEIAAVPGVDVLWVGHHDLTSSMGIYGKFEAPQFDAAMRRIVAAARAHQKATAILAFNADEAGKWAAMGFNVLGWSTDVVVYRQALRAGLDELRRVLAG